MKIGVDLDGVCYDFTGTFVYIARTYRGIRLPDASNWNEWDWPNLWMTKEELDWMWTEGVRHHGMFRYGHCIKGCVTAINQLKSAGHEIIIVTHRGIDAVHDTLDWLSFMNLPISGLHILTSQEPKTSVAADVLIDDKCENLVEWAHSGRTAIRFQQPWNASMNDQYPGIVLARGWKEVVMVVEKLAAEKAGVVDVRKRAGQGRVI